MIRKHPDRASCFRCFIRRFLLFALATVLLSCGRPAAPPLGAAPAAAPPFRIVTSFYPLQVMAMNIAADVPGVTVVNLTGPMTGCLHDYQLTPEAMRVLVEASVFIVNGGGMESFLDKVVAQVPSLAMIDASAGIAMIPRQAATARHHDASNRDPHAGLTDGGGAANPHVWVSVAGAIRQVRSIADGLATADPGRAALYHANAARYIEKLETLRAEMHAALDPLPTRRIVTFHEAFPWFAHEFGLEIVAVVEREPGAEPGAGELAEIIRLVREKDVRIIFSEPQYSPRAAATIARETNARVFTLDPAVTGPEHPDAYIEIMRANLETLRTALAA